MKGVVRLRTLFLLALAAVGCHRGQIVPIPDCGAPFGTASVDFAAATERSEPHRGTTRGGLVVHVIQGTNERTALGDAGVLFLGAGLSADSGKQLMWRITGTAGVIVADSLPSRRYEVVVRRIGYAQVHQHVSVRPAFIDTLVVALRSEPLCLVSK